MHRSVSHVLISFLIVAGIPIAFAGTAAASTARWAWVHTLAATDSSGFLPIQSGNSTGTLNRVFHTGPGTYSVEFRGIGFSDIGGIVQVTAEDANPGVSCQVESWGASASGVQAASVLCFTLAGTPADAAFYASYVKQSGTATAGYAYLWSDQPTATGTFTPNRTYSYNSRGQVNRVVHTGPGHYVAYLPGEATTGGTVKVSAYGTAADWCTVASSVPNSPAHRQQVDVRCFDATGTATNTFFTLTFARGQSLLGVNRAGGYVYANQPTATVPYNPDSRYSFNTHGSANRVEPGLASDRVRFTGLHQQPGGVMVTAFTAIPVQCSAGFQNSGTSTDKTVTVLCYDVAGDLASVPFTVQFFR